MQEVVWTQTLRGMAVDMVTPRAAQVDFREIADQLSTLNRYAGGAVKPVSVALHTLIAFDAASEAARPYVLIHDAHETRLGDIPTPAAQALGEIAEEFAVGGSAHVSFLFHELRRRHDSAILEAAGLTADGYDAQLRHVRQADLVALQTERRDFLATAPRFWAVDKMGISPLPRVYRLRPAPDVADELYARFTQYLPALATVRRRELASA